MYLMLEFKLGKMRRGDDEFKKDYRILSWIDAPQKDVEGEECEEKRERRKSV